MSTFRSHMGEIVERSYCAEHCAGLIRSGIPPVLARVLAARGVLTGSELELGLGDLAPPTTMHNLARLGRILADAIQQSKRLLIVGDYDCDGATACAVGVLALRALGAQVSYLVPNRFEFGYGLTPELVRIAARSHADYLITVDNGIGAIEGVAEAHRLGMQVLVTDHHLPGERLPDAACIINPNQPGCEFPSKHLAGVGVMFYAMLQLRSELRSRNAVASPQPNLGHLLDLVALGTVADVVRLDHNNRVLVEQGLRRIRAGRCRPGIAALLQLAGRDVRRASAYDLGFVVGPRINAAGRLTDMALGIECLLAEDFGRAAELAARLDQLNRERRSIESQMQESALSHLEEVDPGSAWGLAVYHPDWHQGVIGILAARLRGRLHRPVIAFAPGQKGELKGSGRAIPGLHLRDALDLIDKRHPGLLLAFGGHAAAAGVTLREQSLEPFRRAFDHTVRELLTPADLLQTIETDGSLAPGELTLDLAENFAGMVWGQGFPPPCFHGRFRVAEQRLTSGGNLKLRLTLAAGQRVAPFDGMVFGQTGPLAETVRAVYRLERNEWNGTRAVQLVVEHWEPAPPAIG